MAHPKVAGVAVFGVPDEDWGEQIKAVIQPAAGQQPGPDLAAGLMASLAGRLAKMKWPRSIGFIAGMPRDPAGQLRKPHLRDPYRAGHERAIRAVPRSVTCPSSWANASRSCLSKISNRVSTARDGGHVTAHHGLGVLPFSFGMERVVNKRIVLGSIASATALACVISTSGPALAAQASTPPAPNAITGAISGVTSPASGASTGATSTPSNAVSGATNSATNAVNGATSNVGNTVSGVTGAASGPLSSATGTLNSATGALSGLTGSGSGVSGLVGLVSSLLTTVLNLLSGLPLIGGLISSLTSSLGGVTGGLTGTLGGVTGGTAGLGGLTSGLTGSLGGLTGSLGGATGSSGPLGALGGLTGGLAGLLPGASSAASNTTTPSTGGGLLGLRKELPGLRRLSARIAALRPVARELQTARAILQRAEATQPTASK